MSEPSARERFILAMKGIWWNAGEEYESVCRPLFCQAIDAFADQWRQTKCQHPENDDFTDSEGCPACRAALRKACWMEER